MLLAQGMVLDLHAFIEPGFNYIVISTYCLWSTAGYNGDVLPMESNCFSHHDTLTKQPWGT